MEKITIRLHQLKLDVSSTALSKELRGLISKKVTIQKALPLLNSRFKELLNCKKSIDPKQPETIHKTRITLKKFRYAFELFQPALHTGDTDTLDILQTIQAKMGVPQDLVVLQNGIAGFFQSTQESSAAFQIALELKRLQGVATQEFIAIADKIDTLWPSPVCLKG